MNNNLLRVQSLNHPIITATLAVHFKRLFNV